MDFIKRLTFDLQIGSIIERISPADRAGKGQGSMDHIKIIFFDIDGTLVNPETRQVSDKTIQMLHRLRKIRA